MRLASMAPRPARLGWCGVWVVAALLALASARADAASMFVHSASSGTLAGGRLTLHDVGRSVTWTTSGGRAGVASIARAHRRLFSPKTPATGTLHIARQSGGEELTFRLSKPRYSARRGTVSYRARPLAKRTAAASAAATPPRRFGAASLSVVPHASLGSGDEGGRDCVSGLASKSIWYLFEATADDKWDTDTWDSAIPTNDIIDSRSNGQVHSWESDGGLWRGCSNSGTWTIVPGGQGRGLDPPIALFVVSTTYQWSGAWSNTCLSTNPQFTCTPYVNRPGMGLWVISDLDQ